MKKPMTRREFLGAVGAGTAAAALPGLARALGSRPRSRPNIIYVVCHDLGRELGCYEKPISTPNLDAFAQGGVRFTNYFCTSPACSPSRACAYTGQYAHTNGVMGLTHVGWPMAENVQTIVDYFNAGGYETVHVGLQHERYPSTGGKHHPHAGAEKNRYQVETWEGEKDTRTDHAVAKAIAFLESRKNSDKPFYLNVGIGEVHSSRWMSAGLYSGGWLRYGTTPPEETYMPPHMPDVPALRKEMGNFQACIRWMDEHIRKLFDAVDDLGLTENTIVIFTTDHGIAGTRAKGTLYDTGTGIAMLMRMPGTIVRGVVADNILQNIDIAPTVLEAAGIPIPPAVQGRSFWPLLTGGDYKSHEVIFTERNYHGRDYSPMRSARTSRYHYIRNFEKKKREWVPGDPVRMKETYETWFDEMGPEGQGMKPDEELYDVAKDPHERQNLAQDPAFADIKNDLARRVDVWMQETDDPLLKGRIPWPTRTAS